MRDGRCPRCGSMTIRAARNGMQLGENLAVGLRPHTEPGQRGIFRAHRTEGLWTFCCTTCGALEQFVLDEQALAFIREKWVAVPPAG